MTKLKISHINFADSKTSSKEIDIDSEINIQSYKNLSYVVRWQLAKSRSGSAKTKKMSEISGTTAKPWKQKGTGRARQGSRRSVQFVGGRTCHGPQPRDFNFSIPKKIIKVALSDAIKIRLSEKSVFVADNINSNIKTKDIASIFKKNNILNALIISNNDNLVKSSKNIKNVKSINMSNINPNDILNHENIIIEGSDLLNQFIGVIK
jgi:large subunit ribosomal protein L4